VTPSNLNLDAAHGHPPPPRAVGTLGGIAVDEVFQEGGEGRRSKEAGHGRGAKAPARRREWCSGKPPDQRL